MQDRLVTVFGGSGFLGRQVVEQLIALGARVRVAVRNPVNAVAVKPLGGLGQIEIVATDIMKPASVARAMRGADAAVNLVGILKGNFDAVHGTGARNIAEAARDAGATALVQVSAIGADPASPSRYGRSKAAGEAAAHEALPAATIIRPSIVFGRGDSFVNRFAGMIRMAPVVPVVSGGTKFQPVFVADVAKAIAMAAVDPAYAGRTFEIGGPEIITMRGLIEWIAKVTGRNRLLVDVPAPAATALAMGLGWAPGAPITTDQLRMLGRDNVVSDGVEGIDAFGIVPTPLAAVADGWLTSYRKHGRFAADPRAV